MLTNFPLYDITGNGVILLGRNSLSEVKHDWTILSIVVKKSLKSDSDLPKKLCDLLH